MYKKTIQVLNKLINNQWSYSLENEKDKLPNRLSESACDIINLFDSAAEFEECKDTFNCKRPKIYDSLKPDVKSSQSSPNLCSKKVNLNSSEEHINRGSHSSSNIYSSKNVANSNGSINTASNKRESPIDDLLNLNLNNASSSQSNNNNQPKTIPCDLLGNFNAQNIDLLNDLVSDDKSSQQRPTNTSNLDLLNELFHKTKLNNQSQNNPTTSSGPDLLSEPNGAFGNENKKSNLDPFDELFGTGSNTSSNSSSNSATNGVKFTLNSTQPPLKPTQTKPTTSNAQSNNIPKFTNSSTFNQKQTRPDYNRAYFNEPPPSTSNGGPKLAEDAFGDLLGDFTKNTQSDWNKNGKSMAQLKREEMVSFF